MNRTFASAILASGIMLASGLAPAFGDSAPPVRLRGEIGTVTAQSFQLAPDGGAAVSVQWTATTKITSLKPAQLSDIKPGIFVGTAAIPQPDGTLKAVEVHIFPESLRGTGEGYRPFPQVPQGTMTNATVTNIVGTQGATTDGATTLTLTYKDGHQTVTVPKGIPIVLIGPGDASLIKPHAKVSVAATKNADGQLIATRIQVGLGVTPPI
jgi:hypothetical protein